MTNRYKWCFVILLFLNLCIIVVGGLFYYREETPKRYYPRYLNSFAPSMNIDSGKVCLIGNSITANWINLDPAFFSNYNLVNRGVGGETSVDVLLRFQRDVVAIKPAVVVLNIGVNDIGQGELYDEDLVVSNLQSMIDICKMNRIEMILTSVLPLKDIQINRLKRLHKLSDKVISLNVRIHELAVINKLLVIDFHSSLVENDGSFRKEYTFDGIHPNLEGYRIMETILIDALQDKQIIK